MKQEGASLSSVDTDLLENDSVFAEWNEFRKGSRRSLLRAAALVDGYGLLSKIHGVPIVGVVGSKGKGTCAVYASAVLAASGLRVGTILSPGVMSNKDRIRVNGRILEPGSYRAMLDRIGDQRRELPPVDINDGYLSPSGLFMIGGLDQLLREGCQVIVVEAGIGGLSDELSLFPLAAVAITQIFEEHLEILGPTVEDIAKNKSGVITAVTRRVHFLPQLPQIEEIIVAQAKTFGLAAMRVEVGAAQEIDPIFPPGFSRINALLGARVGASVVDLMGRIVENKLVREVLSSVRYPGRLSTHACGEGTAIVDSAISREGLVSAIQYSQRQFGVLPGRIFVSLPIDKDFQGFVDELGPIPVEKYFVNMKDIHLRYPEPSLWPWRWIESDELIAHIDSGKNLVVGTVLFSAFALRSLGANADEFFNVPNQCPSSSN